MPCDEQIANRVRDALANSKAAEGLKLGEIKMFGGLCFTLEKKMVAGVEKDRLMIRLSDEDADAAFKSGRAEPMDFTGKPLRNFAYIPHRACTGTNDLAEWVEKSARYVIAHKVGKK